MERPNAWKKLNEEQLAELETVNAGYIDFLSECKTERRAAAKCIQLAEEAGYKPLAELVAAGTKLKAGDKVWADIYGKSVILLQLGTKPLEAGLNILGAHIDSPRLDVKQNPVYEANELAFLDTHYYGGIKSYQWVTTPLALHGVIAKKDGTVVDVNVGEDAGDPVFCVTDLLPHLGAEQMAKKGNNVVEGEALDLLVGSRPLIIKKDEGASADAADASDKPEDEKTYAEKLEDMAAKEAVKAQLLSVLSEKYGIEEEDFLSAELEIVPAGPARELGFDRSMVLGYGQDDRVCAYTSLLAQLAVNDLERTAACILVDKEEIGSVGATGMTSAFFENAIAEVMELAGESGALPLRRCLANSNMLSSDVSAAFDPAYASVFEAKNSAFAGHGLVFNKFTGARGKSGSNDANAEYVAKVRACMDEAGVCFQTAELGRVNAGGGGTIAYIPAKYGMNVIDSGVAVLSMHAPWEVTSKVDVYEAYRGYVAFLGIA